MQISAHHLFLVLLGLFSIFAAALMAVIFPILRFVTRRELEPTPEWFDQFDLSRYAILASLFHPRDFEFLESQPGYTRELSVRLKADRLKIAEGYLLQLERDVRLLLNFANRALVNSDAPEDLAGFLLKQELRFAVTMALLRAELQLMKIGVVRRVSFDHLIEQVRPLVLQSRILAIPG